MTTAVIGATGLWVPRTVSPSLAAPSRLADLNVTADDETSSCMTI